MARKKAKKKGSNKGLVLIGLAVAGLLALASEPYWNKDRGPEKIIENDPGMVSQGEQLYNRNCLNCHGPGAQGQVPARPNGGMNNDGTYIAPALNGTAHSWHHPPQMLFNIIKNGSPAKDSTMKGWAGKMSDQEINAVIAYFQSLWPEQIKLRYLAAMRQK
ncbi:MAG: cytochrome c [Deltaproteobacteria bacterium]|nr:cytochrome c [Deltaproteobacteria bacterium]